MSRDTGLTPQQRSLRARIAAHSLHSKCDSRVHTQPARDAFMARFERQVDPNTELPEAERRRRAESAKKEYFAALALKSSRARSRAAGSRGAEPPISSKSEEATESAE